MRTGLTQCLTGPSSECYSVPSIPSSGRVPYGRVGNEGRPSVAYTVMGLMVSSGVSSALQVSARPRVSRSAGGWACMCGLLPNSVNSVEYVSVCVMILWRAVSS